MGAVEIIITQGAAETAGLSVAAVGAMKFFAERVFGPSADAIGENLRVFLANRVSRVFTIAGEKAKLKQLTPGPISPGLLTRMIMDASFSEDDPEITDWWANLFLDASMAGSNQHAIFSDIMALLGPLEAKFLNEFIQSFPSCSGEDFGVSDKYIGTIHTKFVETIVYSLDQDAQMANLTPMADRLLSLDPSWPMRPTEWRLPSRLQKDGVPPFYDGHNPWCVEHQLVIEHLTKAGLLVPLEAAISDFGKSKWVRGVGLTNLGYEFYRTCTGRKLPHSRY